MKRGRPSDEYPSEEFRRRACEQVLNLNLTVRQVEGRSGVNRGTISQVLRGQRHCAPDDRHALIVALEFSAEERQQFLPRVEPELPELVLWDPSYPYSGDHLPVQRGRELLMRSLFPEARVQLTEAFNTALARRDYVRAADAAEVMAWLEHEVMDRENTRAFKWASTSIELIERHVGARIGQILSSVAAGSHSGEISAPAEVTSTLTKVLQIRSKLLAERVLYYAETKRAEEAQTAFRQSLTMDGFVATAGGYGHDFRWHARLLASERSGRDAAERRISESLDHFERGSSGEALAMRDKGFVYWQTGQPAQARNALSKAVDLLCVHADARGLGPAFYVLSKVAAQGDRLRESRRYALAAAAFHPYGYVLDNALGHIRISDRTELNHDLEDLLAARPPFHVLHQVMARLTESAGVTPGDLIQRNLSRLFRVPVVN
jgi:transcriptional regulator with XRE-family HTH domain